VDGALSVVNLLIEANADLERADSSGWTAKEHAALRGHLDIARRLAEASPQPEIVEPEPVLPVPTATTTASSESSSPSSPPQQQSSLAERKSNTNNAGSSTLRTSEPVKSFGHRYLTDEAMVLVSLGTMDTRKPQHAVNLDRIPMENAHSTQLDTALSIVVSASGAHGEPEIIDLPVQDNISTEPIVFHSADPAKVRLMFDLVPTYAGSKDQIVGRGVALLSSIKPSVGSQRINLKGDSTVPIMAANTLDVIGSVTFNFLVVTPFHHPRISIARDQTYWKSLTSTMVIGHRGLGKNLASRKSLQLGENTVQSFIAAANLGASYVEFDVQLTKDHVPVIYHDFLVSETGIDAPVHTLTLEQFMQLGDNQTLRGNRPGSPSRTNSAEDFNGLTGRAR
ncbi:Glycerophosphocholine phosphodiesterase, partial [Elasticomyces elasticus]